LGEISSIPAAKSVFFEDADDYLSRAVMSFPEGDIGIIFQ